MQIHFLIFSYALCLTSHFFFIVFIARVCIYASSVGEECKSVCLSRIQLHAHYVFTCESFMCARVFLFYYCRSLVTITQKPFPFSVGRRDVRRGIQSGRILSLNQTIGLFAAINGRERFARREDWRGNPARSLRNQTSRLGSRLCGSLGGHSPFSEPVLLTDHLFQQIQFFLTRTFHTKHWPIVVGLMFSF